MYVYLLEGSEYITGFFRPDGEWMPEYECKTAEAAARRVVWLNGGNPDKILEDNCAVHK